MTTFPTPIPDTGYVLPGQVDAVEARSQAAAWLVSARELAAAEAQDLADAATVVADCWWSNATPEGHPPGAEAGFCGPEFPGAAPVTVVHLSWLYVGGNG